MLVYPLYTVFFSSHCFSSLVLYVRDDTEIFRQYWNALTRPVSFFKCESSGDSAFTCVVL